MLHQYLYPVMDLLVYPLFWFPVPVSLTVVSVLFGIVLLAVYAATSDQWALAFYKQKIQQSQHELLKGNYRFDVIKRLFLNNGRMALYGFVPAVVCLLALLMILPWVGNRFGYQRLSTHQPIAMTVTSTTSWTLQGPHNLRTDPGPGPYSGGKTKVRLLWESPPREPLTVTTDQEGTVSVPFRMVGSSDAIWPTLTSRNWYFWLVNPAEISLPTNTGIKRVRVDYRSHFSSLEFFFPGMGTVPGWMAWFFLVATVSGLGAKYYGEIE